MIRSALFALCIIFVAQAWADLEEESSKSETRAPAQRPQRQAPQHQQAQPPPQVFQQDDVFEQIRTLSGRLDVVENQLSQINAAHSNDKEGVNKDRQALDQKFLAYEDALKKLEAQIHAMNEDLTKMKL